MGTKASICNLFPQVFIHVVQPGVPNNPDIRKVLKVIESDIHLTLSPSVCYGEMLKSTL